MTSRNNINLELIKLKPALFSADVWILSDLGFNHDEIPSTQKTLYFDAIHPQWLRELTKETIWKKRNSVRASTLICYVRTIRCFSIFVVSIKKQFKIADLNKPLIQTYLSSITNKSVAYQMSYISILNEIFTCWKDWGYLSSNLKLISKEDKPRRPFQSKPRALSHTVQNQLIANVTSVPSSTMERLITVLMEVGMRATEVLRLKKDCISQDKDGDWYLRRINLKFRKEHIVPISESLSRVIQEQIKETNELEKVSGLPNEYNYLFIHFWRGELKQYELRTLDVALKRIGCEINLKNDIGESVRISSHQFRHTVGTNLINQGVSQLHVMKFLGHESPQMTMIYAQIHDQTLKQAIKSAMKRIVDTRGNLYNSAELIKDIDPQIDDEQKLDAKWLKRHLSAQALPNGICALPIKQRCPHVNACLTCPSFRTDASYLKTHKEHLERAKLIASDAQKHGYMRQHELNQLVVNNLENIIGAIEHGESNP